ncbi:hypothetical protein EV715DRAFT_175834, partial [Schizophyllum commune]
RPAYTAVIEMAAILGINGVQSGITRMQLANNCLLLGVCSPPTVDEMALVAFSLDAGAKKGLEKLGLDVATKPKFILGFRLVHNYLAKHLSAADKDTLSFGPPFVEHLLCKVQRCAT